MRNRSPANMQLQMIQKNDKKWIGKKLETNFNKKNDSLLNGRNHMRFIHFKPIFLTQIQSM